MTNLKSLELVASVVRNSRIIKDERTRGEFIRRRLDLICATGAFWVDLEVFMRWLDEEDTQIF
jgi:hypothetical protein